MKDQGRILGNLTDIARGLPEAPAHGGRRREAESRYGIPKEELLDFSASINLLGPPPAAIAAIRKTAAEIAHYPEESSRELSALVAEYLDVLPGEVVLGNGSSEIIYWLAAVLSPRRVLVIDPTFSEYRRACRAAGAEVGSLLLPEDSGFALDVKSIRPQGYDLVFICNPNNPTGYRASFDEIEHLWRNCRRAGAALAVDEAFVEFGGGLESALTGGVAGGLYVIRSFTKSFALAGLRIGCLAADAEFATAMRRRLPPWNINALAAAALAAALADHSYQEMTRVATSRARERLSAELGRIDGVEPLPSAANFILLRLKKGSAAAVVDNLGRFGILVRDCRSFPGLGDRFIRVAVRPERENHQLVAALRKVLHDRSAL